MYLMQSEDRLLLLRNDNKFTNLLRERYTYMYIYIYTANYPYFKKNINITKIDVKLVSNYKDV